MSRSPDTKEDPVECPLCMEPLEIDDINFFPCTCGYQICRFCWHRIRTDENGLCPACRKPYPEDPAVYKPLSQEELQRIKNEKKQKQNERKQKISENRKHLASVRVVQKNLVFVVGLSQRLADPEVLKRPEYFGKFGKIHKVVINNSTSYAGSQGPSASAYVTYIRSEDALRAIQCVNNVVVDGRTLKASLGTTKYCSYFLKNMQCPKPDCMYLHELGDEAASFTKEEMQAGKHQEYEQKLLQELYKMNPNFLHQSSSTVDKNKNKIVTQQRYDAQVDKPPETLSLGNGDNIQQIPPSETPSPPPGLTKPNPVVPISSSNHNARSPFEGAAAESQSLFSDNSNFRHPNPLPNSLLYPTSSPSTHDWPTAPEPQSLFTSETIPVSSSTDWQAAFGFGSSKQQEDDLGFDPFDITRKALADLIEKELSVQDQPSNVGLTSPTALQTPSQTANKGIGGFLTPASATTANSIGNSFPNSVLPRRFPAFQHRAVYNSFSFPGQARYPWMAYPHNSMMHLNHTATPTSNSNFLDLNIPPHSTGLGGIPISGVPASTGNSLDTLQDDNPPHWLKSLQALTEVDGPTAAQTGHSNPFNTQIPLHRAGWAPYPPPSNPSNFHSPPPGFQTTFRPPNKTPTDLLQSSALDRH
ncbi:CCR4-NOT transcription complex subunit 4-like isoform X12 [Pristis pectinata]|uniref:CCR4-NOT transcription complex subunit 4-like isoform X12 n=1 Tax=Pristis pectinata TaxID=685728 RepID=UPI00223E5062|nr:CCR4-NOT transcription complex subunit 4-like isoform X12 [Pristis pectinata]